MAAPYFAQDRVLKTNTSMKPQFAFDAEEKIIAKTIEAKDKTIEFITSENTKEQIRDAATKVVASAQESVTKVTDMAKNGELTPTTIASAAKGSVSKVTDLVKKGDLVSTAKESASKFATVLKNAVNK